MSIADRVERFLDKAAQIVEERSDLIASAAQLRAAGHPLIMGGDVVVPSHPLGPPTVSGDQITVSTMLNQPTRITRMIMDLSLQKFITDRVFSSGGGVTGGAVVYDEATANELYATRDVERVSPGAEFPVIEAEQPVPKVAEVEKWGGKVFVTDEARDRNNTAGFTNKIRKLTNTIIRKNNQRAINTLEASISSSGQTATGRDWGAVVTAGTSASTANLWPARDFALAAQLAEEDELGISYNLWLLNPQEYTELVVLYGAGGLQDLLRTLNIDIYVSNRVTAGTAYVVAAGQVGEFRIEKPLGTETWREPGTERTWVQASVRPVEFVTNPFAVLKFTGLAG